MSTEPAATIAAYVCAMMRAFAPASPAGRKLADWLRDHQLVAGVDFDAATRTRAPAGRRRRRPAADRPLPQRSWQRLRAALGAAAARTAGTDFTEANVAAFAGAIGLDALDTDILRFVFYTDRDGAFGSLCSDLVGTRQVDSAGLTAAVLGRDRGEVWDRLIGGALRTLYLVSVAGDGSTAFVFTLPYRLIRALQPPNRGLGDIERRLIGAPLQPQLAVEDYGHVARERDFAVRLLRGAVAGRSRGVNILLYGAPGTGKSEFCRILAHEAGAELFAVGEAGEEGREPSRWQRLDALRLADRLAARRARAVLMFDEMEDVLEGGDSVSAAAGSIRRAGSKVFFNRLLEQNAVPVLWTANVLDDFDPAFLRRMTFAFEMKPLPTPARARLWASLAERQGLELSADGAAALARRHRVPPSLMSGAAQAVAMAGGTPEELDFVVRVLSPCRRPPERTGAPFLPELLNADADLAMLERAMAQPGAPRDVTLCLYGPPGTGKSAFARHLASAMGLDPLVKRGSDLLSKWVGETEQRIARAFDEARQDERFLIIDEAEGFLWSRAGASRSWEVSQVNELLVAMETHPLPFVCTTNHLDLIDPAALRRFSFKVKCDFLLPAQAAQAWRRFFDRAPPPALGDYRALTPGDFAAVARQLRFLADAPDAAILRLLEQEMAVKNLPATRIGF